MRSATRDVIVLFTLVLLVIVPIAFFLTQMDKDRCREAGGVRVYKGTYMIMQYNAATKTLMPTYYPKYECVVDGKTYNG